VSNLIKFSQFNITVPFNEHYSIVFNTLTKALLLINNEELSKLKSGVSNLNITKDVKRLLKLGVLVYEDYDEAGKVINMLKNYRINDIKWRMNLVLVTSYRCNLSCPYCYVKDNLKAYSTEYGKDSFEVRDITRLIMFLEKQFKKNKFRVLNLLWYGGEPLLNIKFMEKFSEELFRFMKAYNIAKGDMMLITNGVLLSRSDIAQKLAKLQINKIQITLDGIPHEHDKIRKYPDGRGTFNEILKALRNIFKYTKARVILRINISRKNVKHMEELIKYIYNNELLAKCEVFPAFIIRWNELTDDEKVQIYIKLYSILAKLKLIKSKPSTLRYLLPCPALTTSSFVIDPRFNVYKCLDLIGLKEHIVGYIDEKGDFITNKVYEEWMSIDVSSYDKCKKCPYLPVCAGGCPAQAYRIYGSYNNPICSWFFKAFPHILKIYVNLSYSDKVTQL